MRAVLNLLVLWPAELGEMGGGRRQKVGRSHRRNQGRVQGGPGEEWMEGTIVAPFGCWGAAHGDSGCRSSLDSSSRFHPQLLSGPGRLSSLWAGIPGFRTGKPHHSPKTGRAGAWGSKEAHKQAPGPLGGRNWVSEGRECMYTHPCVQGCHHLLRVASLDLNG